MTKDEARRQIVHYWMRKAESALSSARSEYNAKRYDFAINRAYYACFYSVSAVLLQTGRKFVKHAGVRAAVHRDLVKKDRIEPEWGRIYDRIFENRQSADYVELHEFKATEVAELLEQAEGFLNEMKRLLTLSGKNE